MRYDNPKFSVIGGDMRQAKLAESLSASGYDVCTYALEYAAVNNRVVTAPSLSEAVTGADCIILPLPAFDENGGITSPLSGKRPTMGELMQLVKSHQLLVGGKLEPSDISAFRAVGVELIDYLVREDFAMANAIPTAEGAIQIAMEELPVTLHGSRCLVIGFGRIGKVLSARLTAMGASTAVSARSLKDLSLIEAFDLQALETNRLEGCLGDFDILFNTVPHMVLDEKCLSLLKEDCLCVDLASKPGGIDFISAAKLGVKAIWALSLPGKVAPATSGQIVKDVVFHILLEKQRQAEPECRGAAKTEQGA